MISIEIEGIFDEKVGEREAKNESENEREHAIPRAHSALGRNLDFIQHISSAHLVAAPSQVEMWTGIRQ